jgi:hypothetical protein
VAIIETEKLILSARAFALLATAFGANDSAGDRSSSDWHTGEDNHRRRLHEEHVGSRCGSGEEQSVLMSYYHRPRKSQGRKIYGY